MPEIRLLLAGLAAFAAANAVEPPDGREYREYTIEVIVFRYASGVYRGSERFAPDPPPAEPPMPAAIDAGIGQFGDPSSLGGIAESPAEREEAVPADGIEDPDGVSEQALDPAGPGYRILLGSELTMGETLDKLERLDDYRPLLHFGWRQRLAAFEASAAIPLTRLTAPSPGLDGSFKLYLNRFLHLAVELKQSAEPSRPDSRPGTVDRPGVDYRISEDRIFKDGNLRYFDHPEFGILVKIERSEEADSERAQPGDSKLPVLSR